MHAFESTHLSSSCLLHLVVESHLEKSQMYGPMPSSILTSSTCHVGVFPTEGATAFKLPLVKKKLLHLNLV